MEFQTALSQKKSKIMSRQVHSDTEPSLNRLRIDNAGETGSVDRGYISDVVQGLYNTSLSFCLIFSMLLFFCIVSFAYRLEVYMQKHFCKTY